MLSYGHVNSAIIGLCVPGSSSMESSKNTDGCFSFSRWSLTRVMTTISHLIGNGFFFLVSPGKHSTWGTAKEKNCQMENQIKGDSQAQHKKGVDADI